MIPHSKPLLDASDRRAVDHALASGQLSQGPWVRKAETSIASFVGLSGAAAVCSGTKAIELALRAMKIGPGDEVLVPSFCCSSVYHGVIGCGARCVPADIEPGTYHLSPEAAAKRRTRKTKAVLLVHTFGLPQNPAPFLGMGLRILEDCAAALGAAIDGRRAGSLGDASIFSFYSTKLLAAGEGGMVASSDAAIVERVRELRECDNSTGFPARQNVKWTDLQAALLHSQFKKLARFNARRRAIARRYDAAFKSLPMTLPANDPGRVYWRYVVEPRGEAAPILASLERRGVAARKPIFRPIHWDTGDSRKNFPSTEEAWKRCVSIPIYPALGEPEIQKIISATRLALE